MIPANQRKLALQRYYKNIKKKKKLKETDIKNRTCYYFDDIMKIEELDFENILISERSFKNVLVYNISYETLIGTKPLCRFNKVDGYIRVYDGT